MGNTSISYVSRKDKVEHKLAGYYITKEKSAYWDGRNESGEPVSSGIYFYVIDTGKFTETRRMILLR